MGYFREIEPNIVNNKRLREPQSEAYLKIKEYFDKKGNDGEALAILPTGSGKSGLIAVAPFGVSDGRVLVITPGLVTKQSVLKTLHPLEDNFWYKYDVVFSLEDMPVVVEYEPNVLMTSLEKADFVISNVQRLDPPSGNGLIGKVPPDFFDMVIVDEAHHSVADSWIHALEYFKSAKKLHVTGTPLRGDGIPIPGEIVIDVPLSSVMKLGYVKMLRKQTVDNSELLFTIGNDKRTYSLNEVKELKEKEWIEKSVALSEKCSLEVIRLSIENLKKIKSASPNVPHKILAVGCSIKHADDICKWYGDEGMKAVLIHSGIEQDELERKFMAVENHECEVVVSVNMLMEGYDHRYLTVLALFRPYRSRNAFEQVVGRVLRAIPEDEIADHRVDNNAIVIYHEKTGLDNLWMKFQKEVEKAKMLEELREEYLEDVTSSPNEKEYEERDKILGRIVEVGSGTKGSVESYIETIDFNQLFDTARKEIEHQLDTEEVKWRAVGLSEEEISILKKERGRTLSSSKRGEFDKLFMEKRPELYRAKNRKLLKQRVEEKAVEILSECNLDPKGTELYNSFRVHLNLEKPIANDGVIVRYLNRRLYNKFGRVSDRELEALEKSFEYLSDLVEEVKGMIQC